VRGQGRATVDATQGAEVLRGLIARYVGSKDLEFTRWLLSRCEQEVAIIIEPMRIATWDYTKRMAGI
jgi:hypothetical protein